MATTTIERAIGTLRDGGMIILADDEQRENEGDFVMAAEKVTAAAISFMAEQARTIITLALSPVRCKQLDLPLMAPGRTDSQGTAFTVTIEAARGVTTGSSAHDRATTIKAAVAPGAVPGDLVRPGHVFPLRAVPGGVLNRAGHTEAACDLAALAGFEPAGLISEIQLANGAMARMPDLEKIAAEHDMPLVTIASLIAYRYQKESLVIRTGSEPVATTAGDFTVHHYKDTVSDGEHVALVKGDVNGAAPLVRVMAQPNALECISLSMPNRTWTAAASMERFADEAMVVLLLLQVNHPTPTDKVASAHKGGQASESHLVRSYGIGAQILRDLGVSDMRLLSSPLRMPSMEGFGLNVTEVIQP